MKNKLLFFLMVIPFLSIAQRKKPLPPSNTIYSVFGKYGKLSFSARLKNYPLNKTVQVQLVSFKAKEGQITDTTQLFNNTPMLKNTSWISNFYETKTLSLIEVDQLSNILYNYRHRSEPYTIDMKSCYNPRNAILFLDEKGIIFDLIEICFECERMRPYSEKINLERTCDHTIKMLKTFFKAKGIQEGVTK